MIPHMTQRCALIRVYRRCYGQERCFAPKAWFVLVIYVCMHSSSKACRLLTTSASRPRSVPMVSSPCARFVRRWTSEHHLWSLLDGIGECSPPLAVSCLCYNTSSSAWMCNQAAWLAPPCRVYVSSCFIVLAWLCQFRVNCTS